MKITAEEKAMILKRRKKVKVKAFHFKDAILDPLDYQEIIDTVYSNYGSSATWQNMEHEFNELLLGRSNNAKWLFKKYGYKMLEEIQNS